VTTETEKAIQEIDVYGFTILEAVLSTEQADAMRVALIECERRAGTETQHRGSASHVANLPTLDPIFFATIDHPRILPILEHFLGTSLILGSLNARIVRPGDPEQGLHSDIAQDMLNPITPVMLNTVWMLDDFTKQIGATRVIPGTHRSGLQEPPKGLELKHVVTAEAPAGSVLVFHGQCWHGGGANTTDLNRHALFGHYRKRMLVFQCDPHDDFPPEWFDRLNDRQKELLRMKNGPGAPRSADSHMR
jgi:ectoine hydroxylase-related dioxygenase (phytanoyl-CoA dioxygenase family)